ncbi:uncharacterized protein At1g08160 [Momordica charantia]|uniref:Uncharacterized protein At1g08160 n=1 Tax=Momordica charantia TaxID=3673 RepID=A0A6J1DHJ8_MOMCH|nr:uncharacterized protein At1g08160 [Momordica charantia]
MAGPPQPPPSGRSRVLRCVALVLLALIVLVGLAVLIIWLTVRPKRLSYTVESASVQNFDLSNTQLNASFNFRVRAYNPNSRVSVYYDKILVTVGFGDQDLAYGTINPFYQPHKGVTRLDINPAAQNVPLYNSVSKDLGLEKAAGEMDLDLWIKAKIRFKVGIWKSGHQTLRIHCSPVIIYLSKSKPFNETTCFAEV